MFQLTELIQRKKPALRSLDASDIVLWKLINPIEIKPVKTLSNRLPRFPSEFFVNLEEPSGGGSK
ncbi:hypothetical protein F5887DRAFT_1081160 [Amanita rubescens]|nr:hypothetical protein F5887DRAFT_1081160 [Amanita rubescens]